MTKINRTYSINEEFVNDLSKTNASELINTLLEDYFNAINSNNLDVLRAKMTEKVQKKKLLEQEIKQFKTKILKLMKEKEDEEAKNMNSKEKEERRIKVEELKRKWQAEEISDEEYWESFDA